MRPVHVIGVPLDLGADRRGVDMGPSALRIAGLGGRIAALGRAVTDRGNLNAPVREARRPGDPKRKYIADIAGVCERLFDTVTAALTAGTIPLVLGGDHSLAAGSVAASAAAARRRGERLGLLWIDAHGDMNTPDTSPSGNVHGMPLAALLGSEPAELSSIGGVSPAVDAARTVLIGIRNLDTAERGARARVRRPRLYDAGRRPARHGRRRRTGPGAGRPGHGRPPRLLRSRRLRPGHRPPGSAPRSRAASAIGKPTS